MVYRGVTPKTAGRLFLTWPRKSLPLYADRRSEPRWLLWRARRFNRSDPFTNPPLADPLSLHKYLYVHSDGINFNDPSGQFEGLVGTMNVSAIRANLGSMQGDIGAKVAEAVAAVASGATATSALIGLLGADLARLGLPMFAKALGMALGTFQKGMRSIGRILPRTASDKVVLPGIFGFTGDAVERLFDKSLASQINVGSAKTLKRELESLYGFASGSLDNIEAQIHHVIPQSFKTDALLKKLGFNVDAALNALPLREAKHLGSHPNYNSAIKKVLDEIKQSKVSIGEQRELVLETIANATTAILDGMSVRKTSGSISVDEWYSAIKPMLL
ncbi:MAG: AHH domain-containing protein [Planctomycetota bacterium]|nr:AHH domain-containing protein [Planctomycetota bacterium]